MKKLKMVIAWLALVAISISFVNSDPISDRRLCADEQCTSKSMHIWSVPTHKSFTLCDAMRPNHFLFSTFDFILFECQLFVSCFGEHSPVEMLTLILFLSLPNIQR